MVSRFFFAAVAAACAASAETLKFEYDEPSTAPIVFSAESRAENASAGDYCLWLDIHYADGTATWGKGDAMQDAVTALTGGRRPSACSVPKSR